MGWVVIRSGEQWDATVYASEEEADRAARALAEESAEDIWVAIANQSTRKTRMISVGEDD